MTASTTGAIQVMSTFANREDALQTAQQAVERGLAACAQIDGPILSIYRWQEKLCQDEEWRCTFKTREDLYPQLEQWLKASHPYDEPQIVAAPLVFASSGYLKWLREQTHERPT